MLLKQKNLLHRVSKKIIFTDRSNELLNSYLKDISKYKILESSEIAKLILEAQNGNEKSKNKVVQSNLRFVVTIAKQFQHRGIDLMDLIAAGNEGIIKAVDNLKPKFREVIMLCEIYGFTYEEASKKLNCPIGTIKSRIYNAKKELAEVLQDLL